MKRAPYELSTEEQPRSPLPYILAGAVLMLLLTLPTIARGF